ncbi:MAG: U32 family peptidase [Ruminococcaceae bacterium]|nr:U32 family peptidase [Oscillospiraceae bacterium]
MIEVLSPAGSVESVTAAVRAGADAVYFGAGSFNARRNAKNFTEADIGETVKYCRVRGVKTYLTLNTLVSDREKIDALKAAYTAAEKGVDALIVQDIGLADLLRHNIPKMSLHASTQMSVHSSEALYKLKEMGFSRVVPAREMDKKSLARLCVTAKELGLEVEVFVHGALCMCLSGQCYLSSILGGRSGNRGLCAQPCRLPFSVTNGVFNDLSLKDMSYIDHIAELGSMGVTSLKIEGRMKRPEYVAAATAAVRSAVDGNEVSKDIMTVLSGVFSRSGHTDGYFTDRLGKAMFGVRTDADEQLSKQVLTATHDLYRIERQSVALDGKLTVKKGEPVTLELRDGSLGVVMVGEEPEIAQTRAVTEEILRQKVEKLGGTPYYFKGLTIELDDGLAVSGSTLGGMRQKAVEALSELRADTASDIGEFTTDGVVKPLEKATAVKPGIVACFKSASQIPDDLSGVAAVVLPVETDFSKINLSVPIIADIPRGVLHDGEKITERLKSAKANGVKAAMVGNLAAYEYAKSANLPTVAGFGLNIFNSNSLKTVADSGSKAALLSFECSMKDAVRMNGEIPKGIISYGRLPLMIFRNCPGKNGDGCKTCGGKCELTDRKGVTFPVMCRGEFSEMFNSRPVWIFDRENEMAGLDFQVLYFTDESKERAESVIRSAVGGLGPDCEHTRGLYYREVL